jgi:hypothetical protein
MAFIKTRSDEVITVEGRDDDEFFTPAKHIPENDALLMTAEAAIFLGVSVALLARDRCAGKQFGKRPLILYRPGRARAVRYRRSDLTVHLEKNLNA